LLVEIFCYGTLLPGEERWRYLKPSVVSYQNDSVAGHLFDTGKGYPGAVFGSIGCVSGIRFNIYDHLLEKTLDLLDEIEGAVDGDYRRVQVLTDKGFQVFAYEFGQSCKELTQIQSGNWLNR
jgi:gamma-glutamylcyclotransferase (GGCT)/AIG2-like uncharacterized protein YtfP